MTNNNEITLYYDQRSSIINISKRLVCGIAMMHFELAARNLGEYGEWQLLDDPNVARYKLKI
ncbi:hypothetical protein CDO51_10960 [Natranaerobius trueperi]|uniref:Uncharacterized protein n=1 Tax=Natranaerobius trueperi TaxID=759412 RepID=A0A226BW54_9FIRM|nr:hypothetical protein CDO51_10960 [Natranaerobius trueperi]